MPDTLSAVVLAGDRKTPDPVAQAAGTSCKALAQIGGRPMVLRVLDTLLASGGVGAIVFCGPPKTALEDCPELQQRIDGSSILWIEPAGSPTLSVESGLLRLDGNAPVLITTADHALLSAEMVRYFAGRSLQSGADATVGLVRYSTLKQVVPATQRTLLRFKDDDYCTCNLFCLLTPAARRLVPLWRAVEQKRKSPWRVIAGILGPVGVVAYGLGMLSLSGGLKRLSKRLDLRIEAVELPFPLAAIDVDTAQDLALVRSLVGEGR